MHINIKETLGLDNPNATFEKHWGDYGFEQLKFHGMNGLTTRSIQDVFTLEENMEKSKGLVKAQLRKVFSDEAEVKTVDANLMQDSIPIRFDPEWISILTDNAPLLANVPERGWNGYTVASNRIDARDPPIGWVDEDQAIDLSAQTSRQFTPGKSTDNMKIFVDLVNISDFSQRAGMPFMNMKETTMGTRMAEHAQLKEQTLLYGDPSKAMEDGTPGSTNGYRGLAKIAIDGGTAVGKSGVSTSTGKALLKDIKKEIKKMKQAGLGINKNDLQIWCSETLQDAMSNEQDVSARIQLPDNSFNFGFEGIRIDGVPVISSHNVDAYEWDDGQGHTYNVGDEGDVFIYNRRSTQMYNIAPLSTVPLGRKGLADTAAIYEYGTLHERANGQFIKYLYDYTIP